MVVPASKIVLVLKDYRKIAIEQLPVGPPRVEVLSVVSVIVSYGNCLPVRISSQVFDGQWRFHEIHGHRGGECLEAVIVLMEHTNHIVIGQHDFIAANAIKICDGRLMEAAIALKRRLL